MLADKIRYHHAEACGLQRLSLAFHIVVRNNGGDNGGIGAGAAYAVFLKRLDKRSLGEAARRCGEVLIGL